MLLLPVQDRGREVKQAAAHLQTLPWKWLFALVWWFITWYSALGLLADGDGINSCAGLGGSLAPGDQQDLPHAVLPMGSAPSYLILFLLQPRNFFSQRPVGLVSL